MPDTKFPAPGFYGTISRPTQSNARKPALDRRISHNFSAALDTEFFGSSRFVGLYRTQTGLVTIGNGRPGR